MKTHKIEFYQKYFPYGFQKAIRIKSETNYNLDYEFGVALSELQDYARKNHLQITIK